MAREKFNDDDKDPDTKNKNNDDNGQTSFIESEIEFEYRTDYINDKVELVEAGDLRRKPDYELTTE